MKSNNRRTPRVLLLAAATAALAWSGLAAVAQAQDETAAATQPAVESSPAERGERRGPPRDRDGRGPRDGGERRGGPGEANREGADGERREGRRPRPGWWGPSIEVDEEEWKHVAEFMQQNSPYRFELFGKVTEGRPSYHRVRGWMTGRFRQLKRFEQNDSELYALLVRQMKLEDEAVRLGAALRDASGPEAESLRAKLSETVQQLVADTLQERERRLNSVQASLDRERDKLETDRRQQDRLVQQRVDEFQNWGQNDEESWWGGFRGPGGPGGPGGVGGPGGGPPPPPPPQQ